MLPILAQAAVDTEPYFHAHDWEPTFGQLLRGGIFFGGTLVVGLICYALLRKYILRARLVTASLVAILATAIYLGVGGMLPLRMLDRNDYAAIWIHRAFAAALMFVALRLLDRLLIVPLMTRGGKIAVQRFIHQIITIVITTFAILGFGAIVFGWDIDKFLEGSAVVSIVLGLALQETLGNFFSGLVMQASSPFAIGDWIICAGVEGRVVDMNWRAVTIHTLDDNHVIMPNGTIAKEQIVNFRYPTLATARTITVGLECDLPPGEAFAVLKAAAAESQGVAAKPPPHVFLIDFAESAVVYEVKFWITDASAHLKIENDVRTNIWYRLKEKGFNIPYPVRTIEHVRLEKKQQLQSQAASQNRLQVLKDLWMFAPLTAEQKSELAAGASDIFLADGQTLFHQDDPGDSLYIIRKGEVDVLVRVGDGTPTKVATLKAGNFFGEMSALTGQPRSATIRAAGELSCVRIGKDDLQTVFTADPAIMEKISQIIAERNAHRHAKVKEADTAAANQPTVQEEQKSLLGKMLRFFGRGV